MRLQCAIILICAISFSTYSQTSKPLPPKIYYKHVKARHKQLNAEVINKILAPLLCERGAEISDITVDFCPDVVPGFSEGERGCKDEKKGKLIISIIVNDIDGSSGVRWIEINEKGGFDDSEYLTFFPAGYIPKKKCLEGTNR